MSSPRNDPARSNPELDYAPPWVRDRMRPASGPKTDAREVLRDKPLYDNRAWHQPALDPELVPEPPPGVANFWPPMLRMGIACAIAASVAAAVVLLFDPKQNTHKVTQADVTPLAGSGQSADRARAVPALTAETSAANAPLTQDPPQSPPTHSSSPPQVADPGPQPQAIAPIPTQAPSPGSLAAAPTPQSAESGSPSSNALQQAAWLAEPQPSPAVAQQPFPKQPAALDGSEISTLIKRGNNLLKEGDFAAARVLFERAANTGSAEAALALGSTYDPLAITRLGAIAVKPDIESARKWYQIAADRGCPPRRCSSPICRQVVEHSVGLRAGASALKTGETTIRCALRHRMIAD